MTQIVKKQLVQSIDNDIVASFEAEAVSAFAHARCMGTPYQHWFFENAFAPSVCHEIIALPIYPASAHETYGKRDSHNELRRFFSPDMQEEFGVMKSVANLFQAESVVRSIEALCGIKLSGSHLRIEYCQDSDGFWLEPHCDIKEKLVTIQIYLNTDMDAASLGTDIYDKNKQYHSTAPGALGQGMIFVPTEPESWHGFEKKPIASIRRSLIINYVTDDWRARHELAFPGRPVA